MGAPGPTPTSAPSAHISLGSWVFTLSGAKMGPEPHSGPRVLPWEPSSGSRPDWGQTQVGCREAALLLHNKGWGDLLQGSDSAR